MGYQAMQCVGRWCWCAASKGQIIPRTFHLKGQKAPNCANHQAFKFSCKGKGESLQPHPTDCARYVKCSNAGVFSCACGMDMAFDRKEGKKKNKIISANTNLFSLEPLNANLNLFYGTRIIMTTKKIPFFCGHKKTHIEKKRYWQLVYKGGKKGVVE